MGWVRISDDYYDHAKFTATGPLEHALWLAGMAWCNRNLTDGVIPRSAVLRFIDWEGVMDVLELVVDSNAASNAVTNGWGNRRVAEVVAARLVKAGLWTETPTGYEVHDYLQYQRSAAQITEAAKANAARQKRFRDSRRGQDGDYESNGVTNGGVTATPNPKPNPSTSKRDAEKEPSVGGVGGRAQPKAASTKRAHRIPDDWKPGEKTRLRLLDKYPGLPRDWWLAETEAFCDHWASSGGRNATKLDWDRAFNVWIKNAKKPLPDRSQPPPPGSGVWDRPVAIGDNE